MSAAQVVTVERRRDGRIGRDRRRGVVVFRMDLRTGEVLLDLIGDDRVVGGEVNQPTTNTLLP
jgi:hypothetical protein